MNQETTLVHHRQQADYPWIPWKDFVESQPVKAAQKSVECQLLEQSVRVLKRANRILDHANQG